MSSCTYHYACYSLRSDALQLKFSAEKAERGEIPVQQILAHVAVRVFMCAPIDENMFVSHAVVRVGGLEAMITSVLREFIPKLASCLPVHACDF